MNEDRVVSLSRRELLRLLGAGGITALTGLPAIEALAQSRRDTLVIGIDTSDSTELDPVRDLHYTPPMTVSACYETLVTMAPGDYINLKPLLATQWARTADDVLWRRSKLGLHTGIQGRERIALAIDALRTRTAATAE